MPAANRPFNTGTFNIGSVGVAPSATLPDTDGPDTSYWTAYDHFMVEREARAMRAAHAWSLLTKGWQALRQRFARATPAPRDLASAPHARLMHR